MYCLFTTGCKRRISASNFASSLDESIAEPLKEPVTDVNRDYDEFDPDLADSFDFDEDAMIYGMALHSHLALCF